MVSSLYAEPLRLVIGNKHLSSWSMRPWLALRQARIPFEETPVRLDEASTREAILRYSPSGRVPALVCGRRLIWDSLAICEFIAELHPQAALWPRDLFARSVARSMVSEMHSGFARLREDLSFAAGRTIAGRGQAEDVRAEVARVFAIWRDARESFGQGHGDFLFGTFSVADAFFAPVVSRFETYGVEAPDAVTGAYMEHIRALPAYREWMKGAEAELAAQRKS
jgi:glutathione S-transferase